MSGAGTVVTAKRRKNAERAFREESKTTLRG